MSRWAEAHAENLSVVGDGGFRLEGKSPAAADRLPPPNPKSVAFESPERRANAFGSFTRLLGRPFFLWKLKR